MPAGSVSPFPTLIMVSCCKYRLLISLLSLQSIPIFFKICHSFVHFTLSKAFSKSSKYMNNSLSCSKLLSHSIRITPIASLVPQPFLNPNWFFPRNSPALAVIVLVRIFRTIFEACGIRLIVLKYPHSVAFSFFSIGTTTDLLKSFGHSPFSYIRLHSSTSSSVAFSLRLFIISAGMLSISVLFFYFFNCHPYFTFHERRALYL